MVYVCGRQRRPGEMNGKSANLNACLNQIYPAGADVPANEIVCIFDADQVCAFVGSRHRQKPYLPCVFQFGGSNTFLLEGARQHASGEAGGA